MARWEFKLPDIGEGVTEGEIVAWLVKAGDEVREDQPMVEVMTDKATVTITSPKAGTIEELLVKVGHIAKVHSTLVVYELGKSQGRSPSAESASPPGPNGTENRESGATAVGDIRDDLPGMSLMRAGPSSAAAATSKPLHGGHFSEKPLAAPATRQLARELSVDLRRVPPTGPNGRVTKEDVRRFTLPPAADSGTSTPVETRPMTARVSLPANPEVRVSSPPASQTANEERTPFVGVRRKIAERMSTSKNTAAHFTFVEECDCTELRALRERLKPRAEKEGVKLTYLAFIARAVVAAIKRHPTLNSTLDEATNELVTRKYINLGIAAATNAGLVVPVLRGAERCSLLELAREIERLGTDAKAGKLRPAELTGSTFTITSLGQQGGLFATPIINFPEVAILGVHQMKQKPVVRNGEIVIGDVMLLSLSFDHRIIDGHIGAAFAYEVIEFLQEPDRLLLEA